MGPTDWTPGVVPHLNELGGSIRAERAPAEQVIELRVGVPSEDTCVLHVSGEIDMLTAPTLDSMVARQLTSLPRTLVLELSGVTFLSSTGLASLMAARDNAAEVGTRLLLVCTGRAVLRPMVMTGLVEMFEIHADLDAALSASYSS